MDAAIHDTFRPLLRLAAAACLWLAATSCATGPPLPPEEQEKTQISPEELKKMLIPGVTKSDDIRRVIGKPLKKEEDRDIEIWTYQWLERKERSAYYGVKIGQERDFMKSVPGYVHLATLKTILVLKFDEAGFLSTYQLFQQ